MKLIPNGRYAEGVIIYQFQKYATQDGYHYEYGC